MTVGEARQLKLGMKHKVGHKCHTHTLYSESRRANEFRLHRKVTV